MVKTLYSILHRSLDLTEFMEEVLIDDNMVFDIDNLKGFLNDTSSFGFIAKENNKIIGFAYCYTLLRPDGKTMFYLHSIGMLPNYKTKVMVQNYYLLLRNILKRLVVLKCF